MNISEREIKELIISWIVIAIAFTHIVSSNLATDIYIGFIYSLILVGITFVFHELAHRTIARRCGAFAEYRLWPTGIVFALLLTFISGGRVAMPSAITPIV